MISVIANIWYVLEEEMVGKFISQNLENWGAIHCLFCNIKVSYGDNRTNYHKKIYSTTSLFH